MRAASELSDPGQRLLAITPADADLANNAQMRALYVGGAGNISLRAVGDSADVVLSNVPAGTILPISVKRVNATNTTATNIVGIY